jgi:hypothetical protein
MDRSTETFVISASLDETLRRWPLEQLLNPRFVFERPVEAAKKGPVMSQEEEDELAELMDE